MILAKECDCNSTVDCRQSVDYINIKWLIFLLNIYFCCNYENYEKSIAEVFVIMNLLTFENVDMD